MRRLRRRVGSCRFFVCGEYGDTSLRPHYHAILFGQTFFDGVPCGKDIFSSAILSSLWPQGFSSFGSVTYQSAAYCAGYVLKKVVGTSDAADRLRGRRYTRVDMRTGEYVDVIPEFGRMSLKPGIGYEWFAKNWKDVFLARDGCVVAGGRSVPPPRYYLNVLDSVDPDLSETVLYNRYVRSMDFLHDQTPDRLVVREKCAIAKYKSKESRL